MSNTETCQSERSEALTLAGTQEGVSRKGSNALEKKSLKYQIQRVASVRYQGKGQLKNYIQGPLLHLNILVFICRCLCLDKADIRTAFLLFLLSNLAFSKVMRI